MAGKGLVASGCSIWPRMGADVHHFVQSPVKWRLFSAPVLGQNGDLLAPVNRLVVAFDSVEALQVRGIRRLKAKASASTPADVATADKLTKLEGIKLYDPSGVSISLVDLWKDRVAVVAFTRHFGCILCRKRAALLESRKSEMDAAGVALVIIAPGTPEQASAFLEQTKFSGEVYADPEHVSYDALEFVNGPSTTLNLEAGTQIVQAYLEGYRQDWKLSFVKDTVRRGGWQQGGIIVAGPGISSLRYLFKDARAGDEPNLNDVISACCSG